VKSFIIFQIFQILWNYNFANFVEIAKEQTYDNKIGSLDLETMKIDKSPGAYLPLNKGENIKESDLLGLGDQIIYAGGWKTENHEFYLYQKDQTDQTDQKDQIDHKDHKDQTDHKNHINQLSGIKLVSKLFDEIFENKLFGYFVHNLGNKVFDSLYLIKGLSNENSKYEIRGKFNIEVN